MSDLPPASDRGSYGMRVAFGNRRLMARDGIDVSGFEERIAALESEGKTVMLVGVENARLGGVALCRRRDGRGRVRSGLFAGSRRPLADRHGGTHRRG